MNFNVGACSNPQPMAFRGIYKLTAPKVDTIKDEKEKNALTDILMYTVMMGYGMSVATPRVNEKEGSLYFKIDDNKNAEFEKSYKDAVAECNKIYNLDIAKKAYIQKVSENEFNQAKEIKQ
ncbi:MAG: hypothetical protein MJ237_00560 [bacterium]|nr:hypothetical protein [bacterium]